MQQPRRMPELIAIFVGAVLLGVIILLVWQGYISVPDKYLFIGMCSSVVLMPVLAFSIGRDVTKLRARQHAAVSNESIALTTPNRTKEISSSAQVPSKSDEHLLSEPIKKLLALLINKLGISYIGTPKTFAALDNLVPLVEQKIDALILENNSLQKDINGISVFISAQSGEKKDTRQSNAVTENYITLYNTLHQQLTEEKTKASASEKQLENSVALNNSLQKQLTESASAAEEKVEIERQKVIEANVKFDKKAEEYESVKTMVKNAFAYAFNRPETSVQNFITAGILLWDIAENAIRAGKSSSNLKIIAGLKTYESLIEETPLTKAADVVSTPYLKLLVQWSQNSADVVRPWDVFFPDNKTINTKVTLL